MFYSFVHPVLASMRFTWEESEVICNYFGMTLASLQDEKKHFKVARLMAVLSKRSREVLRFIIHALIRILESYVKPCSFHFGILKIALATIVAVGIVCYLSFNICLITSSRPRHIYGVANTLCQFLALFAMVLQPSSIEALHWVLLSRTSRLLTVRILRWQLTTSTPVPNISPPHCTCPQLAVNHLDSCPEHLASSLYVSSAQLTNSTPVPQLTTSTPVPNISPPHCTCPQHAVNHLDSCPEHLASSLYVSSAGS